MTREEIVAYLENEAPVPSGKDDFGSVAAKVARHLFPYVNAPSSYVIDNAMQDHWIPRFRTADDDTHERLFTIVGEERKAYDNERAIKVAREGAAAERADSRNRARSIAKRRAEEAAAKAQSKTTNVAKIREALKCGKSYGYKLLDEGTTNPETAAILGKIFGKEPIEFLSQPKRRGRRTRIADVLNRHYIEDCTLRDYVRSGPELDGDAGDLAEALRGGYASGRVAEAHYRTFDDFRKAARLFGFSTETAEALWYEFQKWRAEAVSRIHIAEIDADYWG